MRIDHLRYFADAADLQSIKLAAEKNCMSPQGISRAIHNVEEAIGAPLFVRNANSVLLTRRGHDLLPYARRVVADYDLLLAQNRQRPQDTAQKRIEAYCCTFFFVMGLLPLLRQGLRGLSLPTPEPQIIQMHTASIVSTLINQPPPGGDDSDIQRVGLLLFFDTSTEQNQALQDSLHSHGIAYRPYLRYHDVVLATPQAFTAAGLAPGDPVGRQALTKLPVVSSSGEQRVALEHYLGSPADTCIEDIGTRLQIIREGRGGILVPPFSQAASDESLEARDLRTPYGVEMGIAAHPEVFDEPFVLSLLTTLNAHFRPLAANGLCRLL